MSITASYTVSGKNILDYDKLCCTIICCDLFLGDDVNEPKPDTRADVLFDRLMLNELRQNVRKLDPTAYAELKSYNEPPEVIQRIIRSVLSIFYPEKALCKEFDMWSNCKQVRGISYF